MSDSSAQEYTLEALEEASQFSARTIRYYISQKLVPAPLTNGRNATYGEGHLAILKRIFELKAQGFTLDGIRHQLDPKKNIQAPFRLDPWLVSQPTDDVAVFIRGDIPPWRRHQIEKALVPFVAAVTRNTSEEG